MTINTSGFLEHIGENLISLYAYRPIAGKEIPLLVVNTIDFLAWEQQAGLWRGQDCIILTQEDLTQGSDIFALRYLHMKMYAKLIAGKELFADMGLSKEHIRRGLEYSLRSTCIELREAYLRIGEKGTILHRMYEFLQHVWYAWRLLQSDTQTQAQRNIDFSELLQDHHDLSSLLTAQLQEPDILSEEEKHRTIQTIHNHLH